MAITCIVQHRCIKFSDFIRLNSALHCQSKEVIRTTPLFLGRGNLSIFTKSVVLLIGDPGTYNNYRLDVYRWVIRPEHNIVSCSSDFRHRNQRIKSENLLYRCYTKLLCTKCAFALYL